MKALCALKRKENCKPGSVCIKRRGQTAARKTVTATGDAGRLAKPVCGASEDQIVPYRRCRPRDRATGRGVHASGFRVIVAAPYCVQNAITPTTRTHRHGLRCHGRGAGVAAAPAALSPSRGVFFRRVKSQPALSAVNGATVTSPKEPTTVSMISAETYL